MKIYKENTANFYRNETDTNFVNYDNSYIYSGIMGNTMKFIEDFQLLDEVNWKRFVAQFSEDSDGPDFGWRGEYWGKMMRGACFVYSYTKNEKLYDVLKATVLDMINVAESDGRISSYCREREFRGWDIWCRKYVLLGMQYFLEICEDDELKNKVVKSMCSQVDYIMSKIGKPEDGKILITTATNHWRGLNSASLLEPIVRLYNITNDKKHFDFAQYIADCGGTDVVNIFDLAYEDKLYPYQYPVTKAYEMISCFEGLLELYRITKEEKHKISIVNFAEKILESDFTVIGSCGCTHELFDHSTVRQANTNNGSTMQETCVTVTLMKFFYQLHILTGESKYMDAFESSLYNAYLGSVNTEKVINKRIYEKYPDCIPEPLPFDSYSPLTADYRGKGIGGLKVMSDNHYYGCCACIGAAGIGMVPKVQLLNCKNGFVMNLYVSGTVNTDFAGKNISFITETDYPRYGNIKITVNTEKAENFSLKLRNPYWSKTTKAFVNGEEIECKEGYIIIDRLWQDGDVISLDLDMRTEAIYPIPYGTQVLMTQVIWGKNYVIPAFDEEDPVAKNHIALRRGPLMLAQDESLGYSTNTPISVKVENGYVATEVEDFDEKAIISARIPLSDGQYLPVTDYASAGKSWEEDKKIAVWMLTE